MQKKWRMMMVDERSPSLEAQMAAQARIREASGIGDPSSKLAIGCLSWMGVLVLGVVAWIVVTGAFLGWWVFLTW